MQFAVATPCPCMLGAYSDLQPKVHEKMAEAPCYVDHEWVTRVATG